MDNDSKLEWKTFSQNGTTRNDLHRELVGRVDIDENHVPGEAPSMYGLRGKNPFVGSMSAFGTIFGIGPYLVFLHVSQVFEVAFPFLEAVPHPFETPVSREIVVPFFHGRAARFEEGEARLQLYESSANQDTKTTHGLTNRDKVR
ncbi:hypothetical protein CEP54_008546 [Fusarium duplospermum]|uniref:Uncharacterized protein n=1 Tax=Fusarium duplospermum TaxID=1325734 RepID=A0A428PVC4_9HYPO|nr:hypothetical protein CEP54_008546 [Fusarium duplospermum]